MTRRTISRPISLKGRGVHENKPCSVILHPAEGETGISFLVNADGQRHIINLSLNNLYRSRYQLSLGDENHAIHTVEHLLSALYGLEITDCLIETDASEIPILDGSSKGYVTAIRETGIVEQSADVLTRSIPCPMGLFQGSRYVIAYPDSKLSIHALINYEHPLLESMSYSYEHSTSRYESEIAPARTFGFLSDWDRMKSLGYASGSEPGNTVIYSSHGLVNPPLRYPEEPVRHKISDFLAALSLLDYRITGRLYLKMPGHSLDTAFAIALKTLTDLDHPPDILPANISCDPLRLKAVLQEDFGRTSL